MAGHGRKFKQMRLCADFNAGPSKKQPLFFLFIHYDGGEELKSVGDGELKGYGETLLEVWQLFTTPLI